jgi:predicted dehydrogenase
MKIPEVELVAISDVNGRRAQHVANRFDIPQVYTNYRDMLAYADLDAVSIAVPNYLHATLAIGCLTSGVHVLVEKPMALTANGATKMMQAAQESGKVLFVGMNNRFRDDTRALKLMVHQGALGEVCYAKAGWLRGPGISSSSSCSWFTSKVQAGGGPLWDTGLVMLDLSLWMLGFPKVKSVSGVIHHAQDEAVATLLTPFEESPYPVEDSASALIRFEGDSSLFLEVSSRSMLTVSDDIYLRLDGTTGGAELHNPESGRGEVLRVNGELFGTQMEFSPILPTSSVSSHGRQLQHFVDVCLGREEMRITPQQGFEGVQIIEAIYRSAQAKKAIELPLDEAEQEA